MTNGIGLSGTRRSNLAARLMLGTALSIASIACPMTAGAQSVEDLVKRLDRLEQENRELRHDLEALRKQGGKTDAVAPVSAATAPALRTRPVDLEVSAQAQAPAPAPQASPAPRQGTGLIGFDSNYSYAMLDPTAAGKDKPLHILKSRQQDGGKGSSVTLGGSIIAIADYQKTSVTDDFGYLMRQPGANHIGNTVSEAVIHSVQAQVTANVSDWLTVYAEMLYDPQQNFGAGTITSVSRNQLTLRRGYVLVGNLDESPFYGMIGKIDSPFGQTDTVNPFSLSTDSHAFAGLSYGALLGYTKGGLNVSVEAVQGGAEFRGLNTPVGGTNVPSSLNNFVVDANYTFGLGSAGRNLLVGASYEGGSSYCQGFPITHFGACDEANPAYALYATLRWDNLMLKGDYMKTLKDWPGTFNPNPPLNIYPASPVTSYDIGGKYTTMVLDRPVDLSLDYSILIAGPDSSPWHRQAQSVAGISFHLLPNARFFTEAILVQGYEPLQFLTGGIPGLPPGVTEADQDNHSEVVVAGVNVAF